MSDNGRNPYGAPDAFEGEMAHQEIDRELGGFADEVRMALLRAPDLATTERHLAAVLAEATAIPTQSLATVEPAAAPAGDTAPVARARRPRAVLRVAAAAGAGLLLVSGGLAIAGVRPPEPVSDLLEAAGIDVPGSDHESEPAAGTPTDERGADRPGPASSRTLDEGAIGARDGTGDRGRGERRAGERSHGRRGEEASAEGQATAEQASSGQTPPSEPGASEDNPPPHAGSPTDPGPPPHAQGQGPPASPPGRERSAAAQQTHPPPPRSNAGGDR
ncbi:MAG: hypothetical protein ACRDK9_09045 [Solirubrobacterales bacterium]